MDAYKEWSDSVEAVSALSHMMHAGVPSGLAERILRCAWNAALDAAKAAALQSYGAPDFDKLRARPTGRD